MGLKGRNILLSFLILVIFNLTGKTQHFLVPSDTLNHKRFNTALIFSATAYTAFSIGLYAIWYKKYDQERFHLFNDWGEWEYMDKLGHAHTAYLQGVLCFKGAKWAGLDKRNSMLTGMICGTLFQTTIEVMDGFSSKWGFSVTDMAANFTGTGIFAAQQYFWNDQRISLKVSSVPVSHPAFIVHSNDGGETSSLKARAENLFGNNYFERFLKDYNAQTYWASVNVHSFLGDENQWPKWLNIAVGYGAENMYGGYKNEWIENGHTFTLGNNYKRYNQFYLGLDIDLPKLNPRNPFLKTLCSVFNIFKVPLPALEINTRGQFVFHLLR